MSVLDSNRPVLYKVSIDASGLDSSAPSDGFIDPTPVERYEAINFLTGTATSPTVTNGDTIMINEVPITFVTGSLNLAGIVSTINAQTANHHVVASAVANKLVLTNEALFEGYGITVVDVTVGVVSTIGYVAPVVTAPTVIDTAANSIAKKRANIRWQKVISELSRDVNPYFVTKVVKTGGTTVAAPTAISFVVGLPNSTATATYDEDNGNTSLLYGIPAVKRMVRRALKWSGSTIRDYKDPTVDTDGSFGVGPVISNLSVGALTSNNGTADSAITVTIVADSR